MPINFKELISQLKGEIVTMAKEGFKELTAEAASDGTSMLEIIKNNLKKYTQQLANGEISKDDFKLLLLGNADLVEMGALTEAGLAAAKVDAFKKSIINTITESVFKLL